MKPQGREMIVIAAILVIALAALFLIAFGGMTFDDPVEDGSQAIVSQPSELDQRAEWLGRRADSFPGADGRRQLAPIYPEDRPIGRAELDRVRNAALAVAGPSVVTEVDRSDDVGEAYEVEVVTDRGEVDIALDRNFERVPNLRYDD